MIKMLKELMHEISEFIAEVFKNWVIETRIRQLFSERSKNVTIHEAKYFGWGGSITNH